MRKIVMLMMASFILMPPPVGRAQDSSTEYVVLLHGLARTERSMEKLGRHLAAQGYGVVNAGYPSRTATVQKLAEETISSAVDGCRDNGAQKIHFVTHSMGGILVRYYLAHNRLPELGRVVMLAPPNNGSPVVDRLKNNFTFRWLNGPAGQQLGTGKNSLPKSLGPVDFDLGVIAGDRSVNLLLSQMIPGPDDGKVAVADTRVDGMKDHTVIHATHTFIMKNAQVIDQVLSFLKTGEFKK